MSEILVFGLIHSALNNELLLSSRLSLGSSLKMVLPNTRLQA